MLQKIYGSVQETPETRYSPAICMGARKAIITGGPDHQSHFKQFRGAPKSHHAYVDTPVYEIDEWLFKETGKSRARAGALFHVLQLLQDSPDAARDASDGSRRFKPCLVD